MQSSHAAVHVCALFDEPNLIADAGLLPLVALAERVGIEAADNSGGAHPAAKVMSLLGAMCSGADSIDDADRLRHGAMDRAFAGIRAPSTLGTFLRSFTHGHNRQLHRVHREFLARLAAHTPLLPGSGQLMFIDIDPTHRRVYGRAERGAEHSAWRCIRAPSSGRWPAGARPAARRRTYAPAAEPALADGDVGGRYEELRAAVLQGHGAGWRHGWAVLVRSGMAAWSKAVAAHSPRPAAPGDR